MIAASTLSAAGLVWAVGMIAVVIGCAWSWSVGRDEDEALDPSSTAPDLSDATRAWLREHETPDE